jgi:isocitrate dehydrogenase
MVKYLEEIDISNALFSATEHVINEGKFVTYDLGGTATLSKTASQIAKKARTLLRK